MVAFWAVALLLVLQFGFHDYINSSKSPIAVRSVTLYLLPVIAAAWLLCQAIMQASICQHTSEVSSKTSQAAVYR